PLSPCTTLFRASSRSSRPGPRWRRRGPRSRPRRRWACSRSRCPRPTRHPGPTRRPVPRAPTERPPPMVVPPSSPPSLHPTGAPGGPAAPDGTPPALAGTRSVVLQGLLVLGGLAAFLFLLLEYGAALNPLVVAAAGVILLWPLRRQPSVRALLLAGGFLLTLWLLRTLGGVLAPFAVVFVLAYLL